MLKITDLTASHRAGPYALEAERKMGQLLKVAKRTLGLRALGRFAIPGLLRQHAKDSGCRDRRHFPFGIFFSLSLEHGCFFIRIADQ